MRSRISKCAPRAGQRVQRHDALAEQLEAVAFERVVEAQRPAHRRRTFLDRRAAAGRDGLDAVAAAFLRGEAGGVGLRQQLREFDLAGDGTSPARCSRWSRDLAAGARSDKSAIASRSRCVRVSASVGAQWRSSTANSSPPVRASRSSRAEPRLQRAGQRADQLVAGGVADGVVDQLEVVEVDVGQRHRFARLALAASVRTLSSNATRFGSPVSASVLARCSKRNVDDAVLVRRRRQHLRRERDDAEESDQHRDVADAARRGEAADAEPGDGRHQQRETDVRHRGEQRLEAQRAPQQQRQRQARRAERVGAAVLAGPADRPAAKSPPTSSHAPFSSTAAVGERRVPVRRRSSRAAAGEQHGRCHRDDAEQVAHRPAHRGGDARPAARSSPRAPSPACR